MITRLREKAQVTIPKEILDKLNLKKGDDIDISIKDNEIIIKPVLMIDREQAWFWSKEWQEAEKQVDADIRSGKVKSFNSTKELFDDLDN